MRGQRNSNDAKTVLKWAGLVIVLYGTGYWMGWSNAMLSTRQQLQQQQLQQQQHLQQQQRHQLQLQLQQQDLQQHASSQKQENEADVEHAEMNKAAQHLDIVDSRGTPRTVSMHGIELLDLEGKSDEQDRYLAGEQLSWKEIEDLPVNSYIFDRSKRLPSGRAVLLCPPWESHVDTLQIPLKHLPRKKPTSVDQKYDRRAVNCQKAGIWHKVSLDDHMKILLVIQKLLGAKEGDHVFDWGSGCGHKLRFLANKAQVSGFGLDVSELSVAYSLVNTTDQNHFCRANGVRINEWMPENYFDHALSFGSVYHVYNRTTFCSVLRSMVRVVKQGGKIYNGWTENAEYRRVDVATCLRDLPVKVELLEEKKIFAGVPVFPLKAQQTIPNTYSMLVTKLKPTVPHYWTYIPVNCTTHYCNEVPYPAQQK